MQTIYKILRNEEWQAFERDSAFRGSADDKRDGFIHCSTAEQALGTYDKYFAGSPGLMLVAVDTASLGGALKWEPSRGGALFPHIYGELPRSSVRWARALSSRDDLKQLSQ